MADLITTIEKMQITRVTSEMVEGDKGTARKVHQYICHPFIVVKIPRKLNMFIVNTIKTD